MKINEIFWNASIEDIKKGYIQEDDFYVCLLCGERIEKGVIYNDNNKLYEAGKYIKIHIEKSHGSVFDFLCRQDKKVTGLSEHQTKLLGLFHREMSDAQVQKIMNIGSASTIRNHRHVLKEKEKQAKVFLAMMELIKHKDQYSTEYMEPHQTATMVDDRYSFTGKENEDVLNRYFTQGLNGPITTFSMKEKHKVIVLKEIMNRFDPNKKYTEREVNEILNTVYEDFATLRRYLVEYGFMERKNDCSAYWVKTVQEGDQGKMDTKKEMKLSYKEMETVAGIYQIRNTVNNKILIEKTRNLKTINGKQFMLGNGMIRNKALQEELDRYGKDAFVIEILEELKVKNDPYFNVNEALKGLMVKWMDKLKPYDDRGYHRQ